MCEDLDLCMDRSVSSKGILQESGTKNMRKWKIKNILLSPNIFIICVGRVILLTFGRSINRWQILCWFTYYLCIWLGWMRCQCRGTIQIREKMFKIGREVRSRERWLMNPLGLVRRSSIWFLLRWIRWHKMLQIKKVVLRKRGEKCGSIEEERVKFVKGFVKFKELSKWEWMYNVDSKN